MNKIAQYLQEHIDGEVLTSAKARDYFSTDASVLRVPPVMAIYPKNKNDVRKVARFTWQLAEKGHILPMTARGRGTDQTGAAIGKGIVLVFPAHMNRLLEMDTKAKMARVQPGALFRSFQETVQTHGYFLPSYPASLDYSTIGGAVANNSAGEKSLKYGSTREWVDQLEVVLANGEIIYTGRLSKRELNKKKGLATFEGEIYRQLDGLITDNWELIQHAAQSRAVSKNSSGYDLADVKRKDGSFDLTPLMVGSQGTLGIVTEAIVRLSPYSPQTELVVAEFASLDAAHDAISALLPLQPSALEMVDQNLLAFVNRLQPNKLKDLVSDELPALVLLVEFDDLKEKARRKGAKKALKVLEQLASRVKHSSNHEEQERLWNIRHSAAAVINFSEDSRSSLPIIEDGIVPHEYFQQYVKNVYALLEKYQLDVALWGHAGNANLHMQPLLDLGKVGDRQKVFKLMTEYYDMVLKLHGSIAAEHNDGRLRAPFAAKQHGEEMMTLFSQLKTIFDPYETLNPGVKTGTELKDLTGLLRNEYSIQHLADHLPRF
ncbi:hypothetical protein CYG49_03385 [Candidatus Saccharibacteria bacterium]|nr:MAG: hypothetical protein CYG49_03385 [Candidatus Saccharibacteria bacterium]